ncbi:MAG TPA: dihydrofolate reductase family protein [Solirubrobacteraceae bacterium]|nr:dihydrofolate reductase family protein [Solirubrobacteraceae bacterium]
MPLSRLVSEAPRPAHELLAEVRATERASDERPFVFLNMVATADGRAAVDGRTERLGGEADLELLLELRAIADAVLIGTGTLRAEGYARLVGSPERRARRQAAGLAGDPLAVVITRSFDIPWEAGLCQAPEQPVLIYAGPDAGEPPATPAPVEVVRLEDPTPAAALADLRARGVRALLSEGGPTLARALVADGLLDELFLTVAPLLTGDPTEPTIITGAKLPDPAELDLVWTLQTGSELFLRYRL